jgi:cyclophilin family peptidyl-prolyl cis-trans isomerase
MAKQRFRCGFRVAFGAFLPFLIGAAPPPPKVLAPSEIVAAAPAGDWVAIAASDLLVMDLTGNRRVVIQLMPPPFSQGWVGNIRKLAAAHFWDATSINRVQDNYVVQWGDANAEDKAKAKKLPDGLAVVPQSEYTVREVQITIDRASAKRLRWAIPSQTTALVALADPYAPGARFEDGWPYALTSDNKAWVKWPVHCYSMVGVGRNLSPDTGTGAELYTVIGHAPRHLDRNIALVGRVISGIENLSSLPRGTGPLGFYEKPEQRVTITSIRLGTEVAGLPRYQYLSTESPSFTKYADARANRRDAFFIAPAGGADICNIPVPVRVAN